MGCWPGKKVSMMRMRRDEERSAECFGAEALGQGCLHFGSAAFAVAPAMRPISLSFFCRLSWSSERNGNAVKMPMRRLSIRYVFLNASPISGGDPVT